MSKPVSVEISARHVHVTAEALEILFGKGYALTVKKELSQPGQFAAEERVTIVGPKRELKNVSILGPLRGAVQVEISATDARSIGVDAPVRESGDIAGSGGCRIIGPCGELQIAEGVIVAKRHIHITPEGADEYEVGNGQVVSVEIPSCGRSLVFGDVVVRVSEKYRLAMHIDTDEGNAAGYTPGLIGNIIG